MLEFVAFDPRQVQDLAVVDAPDCGGSPAAQKVGNFAEDTAIFELANVVFAAGEVSARHSTLAFCEEVQRSGLRTLADHDVFGELLQWLTHRSDELKLSLKNWICFERTADQLAFDAENLEQVLRYAGLQAWRQILQKSVQLPLEVQTVVAGRDEGLNEVLLLDRNANCHHRCLRRRHFLLEVHAAVLELPNKDCQFTE